MRKILRHFGLMKPHAALRRAHQQMPAFPPLRPETTLAVIGDVHGEIVLFERLLARLRQEAPGARLICVGDLIDRGEASAEVLRLVHARRGDITVIIGNHEEMLLRFLGASDADIEHALAHWLRNGGLQTLAGFGIFTPGAAPSRADCLAVRDRLRIALGSELELWLQSLPRLVVSGNVAVTHAGADPWRPMAQQSGEALTWGCPDFGRRRRTDGIWVVRGHRIVSVPVAADGVISVDTGAFAGGALSVALISSGGVQFLSEFP